jgi:hypothetical protein
MAEVIRGRCKGTAPEGRQSLVDTPSPNCLRTEYRRVQPRGLCARKEDNTVRRSSCETSPFRNRSVKLQLGEKPVVAQRVNTFDAVSNAKGFIAVLTRARVSETRKHPKSRFQIHFNIILYLLYFLFFRRCHFYNVSYMSHEAIARSLPNPHNIWTLVHIALTLNMKQTVPPCRIFFNTLLQPGKPMRQGNTLSADNDACLNGREYKATPEIAPFQVHGHFEPPPADAAKGFSTGLVTPEARTHPLRPHSLLWREEQFIPPRQCIRVSPVRYGLYLCVPYGSHSKQRLFPQTALTGWGL